ncbi:MAG TPA: hypothetical protein VGG14_17795 [Candidatus Sulfotelmatobacter sp.]|jgi:hypothetical protein
MRSITRQIAWVAVALTVWSALAFAVHQHSSQDDSAVCQVCMAAHSTAPAHATPSIKPLFRRIVMIRPVASGAKQYLLGFLLYVRPPPAI